MVKIISLAVAVMAAVTGTEAAFKQACTFPYDVCGWELTDGVHAYDAATLQAAASSAGQDPNNGTIVYDAIYNCLADGAIAWNHWCGSGKCEGPSHGPNSDCRA